MKDYFPNNYNWSLAISSAGCLGLPVSHIDRACAALSDVSEPGDPAGPERWYQTWTETATRFGRGAAEDLARGRGFSAGNKFRRAAVAHLMANRMASHRDPRQLLSYEKGMEAFEKFLIHGGELAELVEIPYKDTSLPAIFSKAPGEKKKPCLLHFDGFDFLKEFNYINTADAFRKRGLSALYVDHPGVGGALRLRGLPSFPEVEVPAGASVDYLETRPEIDPDRIGIIAQSLGGYYAPRAAVYEKRLKCCIAWGAIWDFEELATALLGKAGGTGNAPSVTNFAEHLMWVFGRDTVEEAMKVASQFKLEDVVGKLTIPYLVQHGENDRQVPLAHARKCVEGAVNSPRAEFRVFTIEEGSCEHCNVDDRAPAVDYMADWAAEVMGGITSIS